MARDMGICNNCLHYEKCVLKKPAKPNQTDKLVFSREDFSKGIIIEIPNLFYKGKVVQCLNFALGKKHGKEKI